MSRTADFDVQEVNNHDYVKVEADEEAWEEV